MTSSDLHIGMVSVDAPPHRGGMGRHVGSLVQALRASGVAVSVFDGSKRPLLCRFGKNAGFSLGLSRALRGWIAAEGIDLLHVHAGPGGVFLASPPIPMIVTANHTYAQQAALPGERWKIVLAGWERKTYRAARKIACISEDTAASVRSRYGIGEARVKAIPCGFDLAPWLAADRPSPARDPNACVFVGRPETRKGWDLLVDAWTSVRARHPRAVLHVAGFREADRPGVRFHGRIPDGALAALVGGSRLLVAPSRFEGFGLAAAEAIAAGTPVVATRTAGLRSVVEDGRTGILADVSSASIADATSRLLTDDPLWDALRRGCADGRGAFDARREAAAYRSLYDEVYSAPVCARS